MTINCVAEENLGKTIANGLISIIQDVCFQDKEVLATDMLLIVFVTCASQIKHMRSILFGPITFALITCYGLIYAQREIGEEYDPMATKDGTCTIHSTSAVIPKSFEGNVKKRLSDCWYLVLTLLLGSFALFNLQRHKTSQQHFSFAIFNGVVLKLASAEVLSDILIQMVRQYSKDDLKLFVYGTSVFTVVFSLLCYFKLEVSYDYQSFETQNSRGDDGNGNSGGNGTVPHYNQPTKSSEKQSDSAQRKFSSKKVPEKNLISQSSEDFQLGSSACKALKHKLMNEDGTINLDSLNSSRQDLAAQNPWNKQKSIDVAMQLQVAKQKDALSDSQKHSLLLQKMISSDVERQNRVQGGRTSCKPSFYRDAYNISEKEK